MLDNSSNPWLVSIIGPTAIGKTTFAIEIARRYATEIVSADSRQFFKELEIGTAKPSLEELSKAKHHFINSHSISNAYSAGEYGRDAIKLINEIHKKKDVVVAVGGSSLYLKSLWEGFDEMPEIEIGIRDKLNELFKNEGLKPLLNELKESDPEYFDQVDQHNYMRVIRALEVIRSSGRKFSELRKTHTQELDYNNLRIGLEMEREVLFERINLRMDRMIEDGLFEEAEKLYEFKNHNALQTVGYTEIFGYMDGLYDKEEAIRLLKRNSRRYAKRQITWFKRYENIYWFKPNQEEEIFDLIAATINSRM